MTQNYIMIVRQFYSFALFQLRRAVCSPFRFSARGSTSLGHNWVAWRSLERSKDHRQDLVVPDTTRHSGLPAPTRTIPCWFTNHLLQWWWWWWRWWRRLVLAGWCLQVGACRLVLAGWCLQVGACRLVPNASEAYDVYFNQPKALHCNMFSTRPFHPPPRLR